MSLRTARRKKVATDVHKRRVRHAQNLFLIMVSVYVAIELARTGVIETWIMQTTAYSVLGSFIAGMFFTSLFTTIPASVALVEIAHVSSPFFVALIGGVGAVVGDLFLFLFVRDSLVRNAPSLLHGTWWRRVRVFMQHPLLRWFLPVAGAIVIASPLPDELGLAMMGISRISLITFVPLSFAMNFLGILAIALVAGSLF